MTFPAFIQNSVYTHEDQAYVIKMHVIDVCSDIILSQSLLAGDAHTTAHVRLHSPHTTLTLDELMLQGKVVRVYNCSSDVSRVFLSIAYNNDPTFNRIMRIQPGSVLEFVSILNETTYYYEWRILC